MRWSATVWVGMAGAALTLACAGVPASQPSPRAGVGLVLAKRGSHVAIAELVPNGPAAVAGIVPGDTLLSVDGTRTENLSASEVAGLLFGADATRVELVVAAWPNGNLRSVSLVRAPVFVLSVEPTSIDAETLYVRIRSFWPDTPDDVASAVREQREARRLILDLRTNSGGQLEPAIGTAELFLPAGAQIGSLQPVGGSAGKEYVSNGEPIAKFRDVFILVNRDTAAGAELFCLALRAARVATLVGERTLGYGTVETRWPDSQHPPVVDGVLEGPDGFEFHGVGVEPDLLPQVDPSRIYPPGSDPLVEWVLKRPSAL